MQEHNRNTSQMRVNPYQRALAAARSAIGSVLFFSAVINILMLTGSIYMLQVYDRVLPGGSVPTLIVLFGIVAVLFAFMGMFDFLRTRLLSRVAMQIEETLSAVTFEKWVQTGLPDADSTEKAQAMRDLQTLRGFLSGPVVCALADVLFVPLFFAVLFMIHPWLGLLTIAGAGLGGLLALVNRALTRGPLNQSAVLDQTEQHFAEQSRQNGESIAAMGMQSDVTDHWKKLHRASLARTQRGQDPSEALAATSRAFRMLLQSAILTLGALLVLRGEISGGMIIASSVLSGRALAPVDQLIGQWRATGRCAAAHSRLKRIFAEENTPHRLLELPTPTGALSVSGLTKLGRSLPNGERREILSNVSFQLAAGDVLGVVGNSASGKSTLARMLVGAGQGDAGEIRLDGATLDQWSDKMRGQHIGYLPQMLKMLPGTITENISRFAPDAKDEDVMAAARLTGIHDMILKLPEGYNTRLGDPNVPPLLSGGQLQRLGLARAVFGMPKIVVLDEPNANLDTAGDAALIQTIKALRKAGSSVIVMAHRPSVLAVVNKLMRLSEGKVDTFDEHHMLSNTVEPPAQPVVDNPVINFPTDEDPMSPSVLKHENLGMLLAARKTQIERREAATSKPKVVRMAGPAARRFQA